jgi:hypothetical protein
MRRIKSVTPGKEELYIERMLPVFKETKKFLSMAQIDHPSLKKSYEYVFEIVEKLKSSSNVAALQALGGGIVIKEFLEIVNKPLKKVTYN